MGAAQSREPALRGAASGGPSASAGQEPTRPWAPPGGSSGPTAPCRGDSAPPSSTSRVGDAGGEARGFRLLEAPDSNFNRPFFSFLLSLSGLVAELFPKANEALSGDVGSPGRMVTARPPGSVSREAAVMFGEASEAAAEHARGALTRPILTAAMWVAGPAIGGGSCGEVKG